VVACRREERQSGGLTARPSSTKTAAARARAWREREQGRGSERGEWKGGTTGLRGFYRPREEEGRMAREQAALGGNRP
jgi:hypothetical protein